MSEFILSPEDFGRATAGLRDVMTNRVIGRPHRRLIGWMYGKSWARGFASVYMPTRLELIHAMQSDKGTVSVIMGECIEQNAVLAGPEDDIFSLNRNFADWLFPKLEFFGWEGNYRPTDLPFDPAELPDGLRKMMRESFFARDAKDGHIYKVLPSMHPAAVRSVESQVGLSESELSRVPISEAGKRGDAKDPAESPEDGNSRIRPAQKINSSAPSLLDTTQPVSDAVRTQAGTKQSLEPVVGKNPTQRHEPTSGGEVGKNPTSEMSGGGSLGLGKYQPAEKPNAGGGSELVWKKPTGAKTEGWEGAKSLAVQFPPQTPPSEPIPDVSVPVPLYRVSGSGLAKASSKPLLTRDEDRRLMKIISEWVGKDDPMVKGGGFRTRAVWNFPDLIELAVGEGKMIDGKPKPIANRGAWLWVKIAREAGVSSLSDVSPGPAPRA